MNWLRGKIIAWALSRDPDEEIGNGAGDVYMRRHHVVRIYRVINIYVHQFICSDDERAKHDHPWWSFSWMLMGPLRELFGEAGDRIINTGDIIVRSAKAKHRLIIAPEDSGAVWTLFITLPKCREWGFHLPTGWIHWTKLPKRELANDFAEKERANVGSTQ